MTVIFLREDLTIAKDTFDPRAELMLGILGSFAEFEWAIIRERQAEGNAMAKRPASTRAANPPLAHSRWRRLSGVFWRGSRKQPWRENSESPGLPCIGHRKTPNEVSKIFPSTQTEQNLGHFTISHSPSVRGSKRSGTKPRTLHLYLGRIVG